MYIFRRMRHRRRALTVLASAQFWRRRRTVAGLLWGVLGDNPVNRPCSRPGQSGGGHGPGRDREWLTLSQDRARPRLWLRPPGPAALGGGRAASSHRLLAARRDGARRGGRPRSTQPAKPSPATPGPARPARYARPLLAPLLAAVS